LAEHACDECVSRTWLLGRLAGHIDLVRGRVEEVLELGDHALIAALGGHEQDRLYDELESLEPDVVRGRSSAGGLERVLGLTAQDPVALVGSRRPSVYGVEMARALGRGLGLAGLPVVSGMALGIDSAAHAGALEASASTIAVLPGSAHRPYPAGKRALHHQILAGGVAVSELGPGTSVRRWMFLARNRIIAGLAAMTVVVEAGEYSGSLVTARAAQALGRPVGAVPGRVTTPQAAGPNELLAAGACLVRGAQDVLDHLFGAGVRLAGGRERRQPPIELRPLLDAIAEGHDSAAALVRAGFGPDRGLAALGALELEGFVRRGPGGRFIVAP